MPAPTVRDRLQHIVDAIDRIEAMWAGKGYQDYVSDELRRLATDRLLEIISEVSRYVPDQDRQIIQRRHGCRSALRQHYAALL